MDREKAKTLLKDILAEVSDPRGIARTDDFSSLRDVDAKVREAKMVMSNVQELPNDFVDTMKSDPDFLANSRRVRLEAVGNYCRTALKFIDSGGVTQKKKIYPCPNISGLVGSMPGLEEVITRRWKEAQKCRYIGCHLSAVIMMGSILEALLLARAQMTSSAAYQSTRAPKLKDGKSVAIPDWNLNSLIDVAVDLDWLKNDRGKFGHALRESRNVVHPWVEVSTHANFDESTSATCWEVLKASVGDLTRSLMN